MIQLLFAALCSSLAPSQDAWPQWGGAAASGVAANERLIDQGKVCWTREVGLGHSGTVIAGGRAYTLGFDPESSVDRVHCIDVDTGATVWTREYEGRLRDQNHTGGTLTTPAIVGARLYVASREGTLRCFDAASGDLHWTVDVAELCGTDPGLYGFAGSPRVVDGLVVVHAGSVVALDADSGELRWKTENIEAQYSTSTPFELDGKPRLAAFTEAALEVLELESGARVSAYPWRPQPRGVNATTPVVVGERVFVSSGYDRGCALVAFDGEEARAVWASKAMRNKMAGCVLVGELIFGFDESILKCLDLEGNERWRTRGLGNGAISAAGDRLVITTSTGELILADASAEGFVERSRTKLFDQGTFWCPPSISGGRVYVRNGLGTLACIDYRPTERSGAAPDAPLARMDEDKLPTAESLFAAHLQGIGGEGAVRAMRSLRASGTFEMRSVGFTPVHFIVHRAPPNLYHAEIGLPKPIPGAFHRVFDGDAAFEVNHYRGDKLFSANERREYADSCDLADAANYAENYASMKTHGRVEFADRPCWRVDTVTSNGSERHVYFSVETGLIVGREGETESIVILDEYARFGALLFPTIERRFVQESGIEELWRVETVEFVDVDRSVFERPEAIQKLIEEAEE